MVAFLKNGVRCFGQIYFPKAVQRADEGEDMAVIIPSASQGKRMKSYGAKSLIELRAGETVITRQLKLLNERFPRADFFVVTGFEADRIYRHLPPWVRVIENEKYDETNVTRSLDLALRACLAEGVLIVYGDLVFNKQTFADVPVDQSWALVDNTNQINPLEVGVTVVDGRVTHFAYGLTEKWGQAVYLRDGELEVFRRLAAERERHRCFGFELLNAVLDQGGNLVAHTPAGMKLAEIDCSRDIEIAQRIR